MALFKCEDCGRDVSSMATACPHCGCPVPVEVAGKHSEEAVAGKSTPVLSSAWTQQKKMAAEPMKSTAPSGSTIQAIKWIVGILAFVLIVRACAGGTGGSDEARSGATPPPAKTTVSPASSPQPTGPTDADKARWFENMENKEASASARQATAKSLAKHFPESPEGQRAVALLPELAQAVAYDAMGRQWDYSRSEEGMSGKAVLTARVLSTNTINLGFPYNGAQRGTLLLRRHPRWGNDVIFRIEQGQILCHSYGDCRVSVKFDDGKLLKFDGNPPEDSSSEVVFIPAFTTFMKQLKNAKVVKIEVSLYQAGNPVFEFDVSGFKPEKFK